MTELIINDESKEFKDEDIINIEQEIVYVIEKKEGEEPPKEEPKEEQQEQPEAIEEPKEIQKPKTNRKPKKNELIDDILKLSNEMGIEQKKTPLIKMKVQQLKKHLAKLLEEGVKKVNMDVEANQQSPSFTKVQNQQVEAGAKALYSMNIVMCKLVENLSIEHRESIGGHLQGYTANVIKEKEALQQVLGEIYNEYKEQVDEYISPITSWALLMFGIGATSFQNNMNVKLEQAK